MHHFRFFSTYEGATAFAKEKMQYGYKVKMKMKRYDLYQVEFFKEWWE